MKHAWRTLPLALLVSTLSLTLPASAQISVMQTGTTYSMTSGDDGSNPFGRLFPASRFTEANGVITDTLTGLVWLKDSQCLKPSSKLSEAQQRIAELNAGTLSGCQGYTSGTHADWRLPNLNELTTLVHSGRLGPGQAGLGYYGFVAQSPNFWSSTTWHANAAKVWTWRSTTNQLLPGQDKEQGNTSFGVLAVRGPVPSLPPAGYPVTPLQTGQTLCYGGPPDFPVVNCAGTGQDGEFQRGAEIDPAQRFESVTLIGLGGVIITDNVTGLQWLVSTTCLPRASWSTALSTVANLDSAPNLACRALTLRGAWRLPNWRELRTLMHYGQNVSAMFAPIPPSVDNASLDYWSSSVIRIGAEDRYLYVSSNDGALRTIADPSGLREVIGVRRALHQVVSATPTSISFGSITVGGNSAPVTVTIKSSGDAVPLGTLRVRSGASHFFLQSDNCSGKVPGSNGCTVTVVFSPKLTGPLKGVLEITDLLTVALDGNGSGPTIAVDPSGPIWWLLSDPSQEKSVTVTAGGSGPLTISSLSFGGTNPNDFGIVAEDCTQKALQPGESCTITLSFFPGAGGERMGELKIASNAPNNPVLSVSLVTLGEAPFIEVSPGTLDFGTQGIGTTTTKNVTITNTGNGGPLVVDSLAIKGSGKNSYGISATTCAPTGLAPGESCSVTISFTPTNGIKLASLEVKSNDPARPTVEVTLAGTGTNVIADPEPDTTTPDTNDGGPGDVADTSDTTPSDVPEIQDGGPGDTQQDVAPADTSDVIDAQDSGPSDTSDVADLADQGAPDDSDTSTLPDSEPLDTNGTDDTDTSGGEDGEPGDTNDATDLVFVDSSSDDTSADTSDSSTGDTLAPDSESDASGSDGAGDDTTGAPDGDEQDGGQLGSDTPSWGITPSGTVVGETMSLRGSRSGGGCSSTPSSGQSPPNWLSLLLACLVALRLSVRRSGVSR